MRGTAANKLHCSRDTIIGAIRTGMPWASNCNFKRQLDPQEARCLQA
jgi:hypothetical protein